MANPPAKAKKPASLGADFRFDEVEMAAAAESLWAAVGETADFAEFEGALLAASNEVVRDLLKKRSNR